MDAGTVIAGVLSGLVTGLADIGKVVAARKVQEIIRDEFPEFYERAHKAGERERDKFDEADPPSGVGPRG